jgi:peptidoglycan/LPS O-acetylase OafA/YrhL
LLLAVLVLFSHCFPLTLGSNKQEPLFSVTQWLTLGILSVDFFFVISGYLITQSWIRSASATDFLRKRLLRIYPGYLVAFLLSIVVGVIGAGELRPAYMKQLYVRHHLVMQGLVFLDGGTLDSPKAFSTNPFPRYVNGSLWTLLPEWRCYTLVLMLGVLGAFSFRYTGLFAFLIAYTFYAHQVVCLGNPEFSLWRLITFFFSGMVVATLPGSVSRLTPWMGMLAVGGLVLAAPFPVLLALSLPILGTIAILSIGLIPSDRLGRLFAGWDLSYGMYLYAFPVQQMLVYGLELRSPLLLLQYSLPITVVLAWISWHVIERPALRFAVALRLEPTETLVTPAKSYATRVHTEPAGWSSV